MGEARAYHMTLTNRMVVRLPAGVVAASERIRRELAEMDSIANAFVTTLLFVDVDARLRGTPPTNVAWASSRAPVPPPKTTSPPTTPTPTLPQPTVVVIDKLKAEASLSPSCVCGKRSVPDWRPTKGFGDDAPFSPAVDGVRFTWKTLAELGQGVDTLSSSNLANRYGAFAKLPVRMERGECVARVILQSNVVILVSMISIDVWLKGQRNASENTNALKERIFGVYDFETETDSPKYRNGQDYARWIREHGTV
ncbi:unnamed protein product [Caenorhabditis auriculariae]|uniref:Uncharacterized protein n=1 Tax=Caenorhabditis auriculariae TaxID=2777116 RepID=A0A8S1HSR9_9PELO|nr:unnamed protein product [Caenorhabditis auriculariae]